MRTVSPRTRRGGQLLGGRGWSSAAWLVRPELCHARVFLDSASWRGMTRVPPRLRCALCHPALDAGSRESRREIYSRSLLQELLDSASLRGMTEPPHQVRNDIVVGISLKLVLWNAPEYALCSAAIPPPLSGREEASRPRPEGEDCLSAASSAAPEGGASLRAMKPDNSGGASWFVLLAAEKNEHVVSPALDAGSSFWRW